MIPKHTISVALKNLRREVVIVVYADEKLLKFAREISNISEKVKVEFVEEGDPLLGKGAIRVGKEGRVYFHGLPRYTELESFLTALRTSGNGEGEECEGGNIAVLTFVSTFCPNCRSSVDAINSLLSDFMCLEHHVIDIDYLPDLAESFGIESVPTVIVGDFRTTGAMSRVEAERFIAMAVERRYDLYFAEKLMRGEIEEVKSIVSKSPELMRTLAELISHREFIVRLGAMAVIEALHKVDPRITEPARDVIRKLVRHDDVRIREDAVMMLGIIGGEEEIEILKEVAVEGGRVADSVDEAITNIRERIGK